MKLTKETLDVFKNFAALNMSILVREGSTLRTVTPQKNVMGIANVQEHFPSKFAIYDLNQFLGAVSLFDDPEFEFEDKFVNITDNTGASARYIFADENSIVAAPDKDITLPSIDCTLQLESNALQSALKAASVLGLPNVAFIGDGNDVFITALDSNNNSAHNWKRRVGSTTDKFKIIYKLEILKFLPREYIVSISKKFICKFEAVTKDITYYVAAETGSSFDG